MGDMGYNRTQHIYEDMVRQLSCQSNCWAGEGGIKSTLIEGVINAVVLIGSITATNIQNIAIIEEWKREQIDSSSLDIIREFKEICRMSLNEFFTRNEEFVLFLVSILCRCSLSGI